ncbi:MAG TPA: aminotransferase class V-fold PLP-dependent enzyme [Saprospiraceae bacterium]|nr:aminotransferase class V-fold PLP-dependent enzyme [Saprospiraceae bacterium]HMQ85263.1 aminotransferase class V-fold PLP-dependent enzyme [Saprospiraceae bacterium]
MKKNDLIYLDNNATTPVDPRALKGMLPYFYDLPGNAASRNHPFGWMADEAVQQARAQVAALIQADPREIIFTSGATESVNLALKGIFELYYRKGRHIVTVKTEHKAVLDVCARIEKLGGEITYLEVLPDGRIDLDELNAAIRPDTILVSVMWANNETGVIQDMPAISVLCEQHGTLLMSDATQAVGKIPVSPREAGVHLMAFSAHKMYGPKGVGALYVSRKAPRVKVGAQMDGGGHEEGMRSGTLNVPGIVGFGHAAHLAQMEMEQESKRLAGLRDRLESALLEQLEEVSVNGNTQYRLPHVCNLTFRLAEAEAVMMTFNQKVALSSGSACTSASLEPSHVLTAMGLRRELAQSSLRFSLGRFTTKDQIDEAIELVAKGVKQVRHASPVWEMYKEGLIDV